MPKNGVVTRNGHTGDISSQAKQVWGIETDDEGPKNASKVSAQMSSSSSKASGAGEGTAALIIFGVDLSNLPPSVQYIVLTAGLFLFTCSYGYYQEVVIYSWFRRRLGCFTTMLFFIGNAVCSIGEKLVLSGTKPLPRKSPWRYHIFLSVVKLLAQVLTNMSMTHINYPAKVLFKSSIPVAQMVIGLSCLGRRYPVRDYLVISLLFVGLYTFITGNPKQPDASGWGIFLVTCSMLMAASVPMVQEHCMITYGSTPTEMLYFSFMGGAAISAIVAIVMGEFHQGIAFMYSQDARLLPDGPHSAVGVHEYDQAENPWLALFMFSTLGYLGAHCSTAITQHFGSLLNGITNTARKATSLSLSYFMFPDEHVLTWQHVVGSAIFFAGLVVRAVGKGDQKPGKGKGKGKGKLELPAVPDTEGAVYDVDSPRSSPNIKKLASKV